MQFDRQEFIEEIRLRRLIRRGIRILEAKKKKKAEASLLEEQKLRKVIRQLIAETATPDNDPAPHKSTGINVLEDLLKKIIEHQHMKISYLARELLIFMKLFQGKQTLSLVVKRFY